MSLQTAIFAYLSADAQLTALVNTRIYPVRLPEKATIPAITYRRVSTNREETYGGGTDTWVRARVQFNCWGRSETEAADVGTALLILLSGYDGDMGGELLVSSSTIDEFDFNDAPVKFFRHILDFRLSYEDELSVSS